MRRNLVASPLFALLAVLLPAGESLGQTPLSPKLEITLLPGYAQMPLQGIDSIVGKIAKPEGLSIQYEIGPVPQPGGLRFGGSFTDYTTQVPENSRLWLKEQTVGGRRVRAVYTKENRLVVSSASATDGVNFSAVAKTSGDVADVLLMVFSLADRKAKP